MLYPSTVLTATSLLNCKAVPLSPAGAGALDGGGAAAAAFATANGGTISLVVNAENPFFVCWRGTHFAMGVAAALTMAIYVAIMPLLTLLWLWRDPWVRQASAAYARRDSPHCAGGWCTPRCRRGASGPPSPEASLVVVNPMHSKQRNSEGCVASAPHAPHDSAEPGASPVLEVTVADDRALGLFFRIFKPSAWWQRHTELALLLVLSVHRGLVPSPATLQDITTKAAVTCTALLAALAHLLVVQVREGAFISRSGQDGSWARPMRGPLPPQPFIPGESWMTWVRAALLVDSMGCALLNAAVSAIDAELASPAVRRAVDVGSPLLLCFCVLTLAILVLGVAYHIYIDAAKEQEALGTPRRHRSATWDCFCVFRGRSSRSIAATTTPNASGAIGSEDLHMQENPFRAAQSIPVDAAMTTGSDVVVAPSSALEVSDPSRSLGYAAVQSTRSAPRRRNPLRDQRLALASTLADPSTSPSLLLATYETLAHLSGSVARRAARRNLPHLADRLVTELSRAGRDGGEGSGDHAAALFDALAHMAEAGVDILPDIYPSFVSSGAIGALVAALVSPTTERETISRALRVLSILSVDENFAAAFVEAGAVGAAVRLVLDAHPDIVLEVLVTLTSLADFPGGAAALSECDAVVTVCSVLRDQSATDVGALIASCQVLQAMLLNHVMPPKPFAGGASGSRDSGGPHSYASVHVAAVSQLLACGGISALVGVLGSARAAADAEVALSAAAALTAALARSDSQHSMISGEAFCEPRVAAAALKSGALIAAQGLMATHCPLDKPASHPQGSDTVVDSSYEGSGLPGERLPAVLGELISLLTMHAH